MSSRAGISVARNHPKPQQNRRGGGGGKQMST